jgi:cytochrome b561
LFAVPLSGWLFDSASSLRPLYWWGLISLPSLTGGANPALKEVTRNLHEWLFWLLVFVALGHAAMAVIHQFVNRDGTLARMLPGGRRLASISPASNPPTESSNSQPVLPETVHVEPAPASVDPVAPAARGPGA